MGKQDADIRRSLFDEMYEELFFPSDKMYEVLFFPRCDNLLSELESLHRRYGKHFRYHLLLRELESLRDLYRKHRRFCSFDESKSLLYQEIVAKIMFIDGDIFPERQMALRSVLKILRSNRCNALLWSVFELESSCALDNALNRNMLELKEAERNEEWLFCGGFNRPAFHCCNSNEECMPNELLSAPWESNYLEENDQARMKKKKKSLSDEDFEKKMESLDLFIELNRRLSFSKRHANQWSNFLTLRPDMDRVQRSSFCHGDDAQMVLGAEVENVPEQSTYESLEVSTASDQLNSSHHPHMCRQSRREATFGRGWPSGRLNATTSEIAEAGFFYLGEQDHVKCFYCNGGLQNWETVDDPWTEHAKWFPDCQFLLQTKGYNFVRGCLTRGADLPHPNIRAQHEENHLRNQNQEESGSSASYNNAADCGESVCHKFTHGARVVDSFDSGSFGALDCGGSIHHEIFSGARVVDDFDSGSFGALDADFNARQRTFENLPQEHVLRSPDFPSAGFYYTGERDRVKCACCKRVVENWGPCDKPLDKKWHRSSCGILDYLDSNFNPSFLEEEETIPKRVFLTGDKMQNQVHGVSDRNNLHENETGSETRSRQGEALSHDPTRAHSYFTTPSSRLEESGNRSHFSGVAESTGSMTNNALSGEASSSNSTETCLGFATSPLRPSEREDRFRLSEVDEMSNIGGSGSQPQYSTSSNSCDTKSSTSCPPSSNSRHTLLHLTTPMRRQDSFNYFGDDENSESSSMTSIEQSGSQTQSSTSGDLCDSEPSALPNTRRRRFTARRGDAASSNAKGSRMNFTPPVSRPTERNFYYLGGDENSNFIMETLSRAEHVLNGCNCVIVINNSQRDGVMNIFKQLMIMIATLFGFILGIGIRSIF